MKFSFKKSILCPNCNGKNTLREFYYGISTKQKEYYCSNANCDYITCYNMEYEKAKQDYLLNGTNYSNPFQFTGFKKEINIDPEVKSHIGQKIITRKDQENPTLPLSKDDPLAIPKDNRCPHCDGELIPFKDQDDRYTPHYFCTDQNCRYSTIYGFGYESAIKEYLEKKRHGNTINNPAHDRSTTDYTIKLDNIIGYDGIKRKLREIINHKGRKKIHVLIVGAAGTSKTVFLKSLEDELLPQGCNFHYIDAATMTKRGLLDYMFDNEDIEILAVDELDKVDKEHQTVFLNMLETGVLQTTSYNNIRRKEVKSLICIATGNDLKKIIEPVRTRFLTFYLKAYTKEQYLDVCIDMLVQKYSYIDRDLAEYIASETYKKIKPINMRDADRIGNLIRGNPTKERVDQSLDDIISYAIPNHVLDKLDRQT